MPNVRSKSRNNSSASASVLPPMEPRGGSPEDYPCYGDGGGGHQGEAEDLTDGASVLGGLLSRQGTVAK